MKTAIWLIVHLAVMAGGGVAGAWLAIKVKEQATIRPQNIVSIAKLFCMISALAITLLMVMYVSGVVTYATAR